MASGQGGVRAQLDLIPIGLVFERDDRTAAQVNPSRSIRRQIAQSIGGTTEPAKVVMPLPLTVESHGPLPSPPPFEQT